MESKDATAKAKRVTILYPELSTGEIATVEKLSFVNQAKVISSLNALGDSIFQELRNFQSSDDEGFPLGKILGFIGANAASVVPIIEMGSGIPGKRFLKDGEDCLGMEDAVTLLSAIFTVNGLGRTIDNISEKFPSLKGLIDSLRKPLKNLMSPSEEPSTG